MILSFDIRAYAASPDPYVFNLANPTIVSAQYSSSSLYFSYSNGFSVNVTDSLNSFSEKAVLYPMYNPRLGPPRYYYISYSGQTIPDSSFPVGTQFRFTATPDFSDQDRISVDYTVSLGYSGYVYSLEYNDDGVFTQLYVFPGILRNDLLTSDTFVTTPSGFNPVSSRFELYYLDLSGAEHLLVSSTGGASVSMPSLFPVVINDVVSDIIFKYHSDTTIATRDYAEPAGIDHAVVTAIVGLDPLMFVLNPPDTFFLVKIWDSLLDILKSLGSHIGQTVDSILSSIGNAVGSTLNNILTAIQQLSLGWQAPPDRGAEASQFIGDIGDVSGDIDSANDAIESLVPRPPPDSVLSTLPPDFVAPVDQSVVTMKQSVADIMSNQLILSMLLIVFTLALGRYILFGKSGS